jgi:hypothetical protein
VAKGPGYTQPIARLCGESRKKYDVEQKPMEWVTPQHETIDLNCEVSSYANAEL